MQETPNPNNVPRPGGAGARKFRYKYADVSCDFCLQTKQCKGKHCMFILDNLEDLLLDAAFNHAVENADSCDTWHKETLIYLKNNDYT